MSPARSAGAACETTAPESGKPAATPRSNDFIRELILEDISNGTFAGRVQTRFPPEPNGYLHIGHAKAICLDFGVAAEFGGTCRLRFDDTNPATATDHYAQAIREDINWLGFELDGDPVYASDYFEQLYLWAEYLVSQGLAYVDDSDAGTISASRGSFGTAGVDSVWRDRSIDENLDLLRRMRSGEFGDAEKVLRARIDMSHADMTMRDPVMYRIRHVSHFRTAGGWCIYPTYDWAHGQSDAIEGVTHSLCSLEFDSHRPLYDWYLANLPLPGDTPRQTEFARLNLTHTVTSKRKLATLVSQGLVDGWDDPRMPTLRGLKRRGYPAEAIRAFCAHIGVSRVNGVHEIELLESFVRDFHNRHALRRMAVLRPLEVVIENWDQDRLGDRTEWREALDNPEDPAAGTRRVPLSGRLWIERDDFMLDPPAKFYRLAPGREVRMRAGYFLRCNDVSRGAGGEVQRLHCSFDPETGDGHAADGRRVKATIHWVSADHAGDAAVALYDRLFIEQVPGAAGGDPLDDYNPASRELLSGCKVEPALAEAAPGEVVQFERLGYFARDFETPLLFHRAVGLRDEWARIRKQKP